MHHMVKAKVVAGCAGFAHGHSGGTYFLAVRMIMEAYPDVQVATGTRRIAALPQGILIEAGGCRQKSVSDLVPSVPPCGCQVSYRRSCPHSRDGLLVRQQKEYDTNFTGHRRRRH